MAISCNCKSLCPKLWHSLKSLNCWSFRVRVSDVSDVSGQSTGLPGHSRQRRPKLWGGHCCENPAVPLHLSGSADAGQMQMSWDELKSLESLESLVIWIICQSYVNHMSIICQSYVNHDHCDVIWSFVYICFLYLSCHALNLQSKGWILIIGDNSLCGYLSCKQPDWQQFSVRKHVAIYVFGVCIYHYISHIIFIYAYISPCLCIYISISYSVSFYLLHLSIYLSIYLYTYLSSYLTI